MSEVNQEGQPVQGIPLSNIQETHGENSCSIARQEIGSDWTEEEEQDWDALLAQPHVHGGFSQVSEEAKQQFILGEIKEGGFAIE